ncbi:glutamate carboxypeptidase [Falsibacillus pallidus]|uniref:Glutamate carboxypeptidase n=2 Tax=Falsibacillus pallidus TaxID=493781 RepID=A0A370GQ11_9BACI|nr:glutamate carboxypeptidase [Falsibacillus pallidus]
MERGMDMNELVAFLKDNELNMLNDLRELVEIESPSTNKQLTNRAGDWIQRNFMHLTGGLTEVIAVEEYGNHIRAQWAEGNGQLLILAHFDTVWPEGTLSRMPFRLDDGKVYGPGTFDMKGGIIQGLYALHALSQLGIKLNKKVVWLFTSDEEIGSPSSEKLIEKEAAKSERVFVLEPSMDGALKTSRKGVGMFKMKVEGIPAHSGVDPEKGVSAIEEMAHQILYLHGLTDLSIGTTVNVGTVHGGTTGNVMAAEANADIDLRVKSKKEFDRLLPLIQQLKPVNPKAKITVEGGINRPTFERTKDTEEMYLTAKKIAQEQLGFTLEERETGGGSDGNFTAPLAPTLDGLGPVGDGAHAEHEHLIWHEMPIRSALLAMLLIAYGK